MTSYAGELESLGFVEVETIFLHDRPLDSDVFADAISFLQGCAYAAVTRQLNQGVATTLDISPQVLSSATAYEEANQGNVLWVEGVQDGTSKIKSSVASAAAFLAIAGGAAEGVAVDLSKDLVKDAIKSTQTFQTVQEKANELTQEFEKFLIEEIDKASSEFKKGRIFAVQSQGKVYVIVQFPGTDYGIRISPPGSSR